jgi:hypothetical protein
MKNLLQNLKKIYKRCLAHRVLSIIVIFVMVPFLAIVIASTISDVAQQSSRQANLEQDKKDAAERDEQTNAARTAARKALADQISVESNTVKKVSDRYRYFFTLRNNSPEQFNVTVIITLVNAAESRSVTVIDESFDPIKALAVRSSDTDLEPYTDISAFKYKVIIDNDVFDYPPQLISDRYENTN